MGDYWHKNYQCPFYGWSDKVRICCECGSVLRFPDGETAKGFLDAFCAGEWKTCSIAQTLWSYYEKEDEREKSPGRAAAQDACGAERAD